MDPASGMAGVGMGTSALGGLVSAYGQLKAGDASQKMYQYKAGLAQINQTLATQNADYTRKVGEVQAGESGMRSRFQMGKIVTGQAGSGIDINSGTGVNVRQGQTLIAQEDQSIIRANAARKAYGYDVEAAKEGSEATVDIVAGDEAKSASKIAALSSILGSASSVATKWSTASQYGLYNAQGPIDTGDGSQSSMGGGYGGGNFS